MLTCGVLCPVIESEREVTLDLALILGFTAGSRMTLLNYEVEVGLRSEAHNEGLSEHTS